MQPGTARAWLRIIAFLHILGGLSLPVLLQTRLFDLYQTFNSTLLGVLPFGQAAPGRTAFDVGLFGPTIASWGILFLFAVDTAFTRRDKAGWWSLILSALVWAPYDAALSISRGISINALADLIVLASILLPLLWTRSHFFAAPSAS